MSFPAGLCSALYYLVELVRERLPLDQCVPLPAVCSWQETQCAVRVPPHAHGVWNVEDGIP